MTDYFYIYTWLSSRRGMLVLFFSISSDIRYLAFVSVSLISDPHVIHEWESSSYVDCKVNCYLARPGKVSMSFCIER